MHHIMGNYLLLLARMLMDTIRKNTEIIINESFNTFHDGYFQMQLFSNTILAILDKIMDMNTGKFKKLCEI